jgi:ParB family transcriptional regulator, chromosome partitioning protein
MSPTAPVNTKKNPTKTTSANRFDRKIINADTVITGQNIRRDSIKALQSDSNLSQLIDPNVIKPALYQVRKTISPAKWQSFVDDIKANGVYQNLIVRRVGDVLELVVGQRRQKAAIEAGRQVPVVVLEGLSDADALRIMMAENDQREDVNVLDQTEGILQLIQYELGLAGQKETINVIAAIKTGYKKVSPDDKQKLEDSRQVIEDILNSHGNRILLNSFLQKKIPLLSLPNDIKAAIRENNLSYTAAMAIGEIKDAGLRRNTLGRALNDDLSVRGIRNLVDEIMKPAKKTKDKADQPSSGGGMPSAEGRAPDESSGLSDGGQASSNGGQSSADAGQMPSNGVQASFDEAQTPIGGQVLPGASQLPSKAGQTLSAQDITTELKTVMTQITKIDMLDEKILSEAEIIIGFLKDFLKTVKDNKKMMKE